MARHVLLLVASLSLGIISLITTEVAGINTPLGILISSFLTPIATIGCIASAQHYFKRATSAQFRTIILFSCFVTTGVITVILLPNKSMSNERLFYSLLRMWWLCLLFICLGLLLRRSLLTMTPVDVHSETHSSFNTVRKHSSDDGENDENTSLLGEVRAPAAAMLRLSHFSYPLLFVPLFFAILSLVVPPFWTSNHNVSGYGVFGALDVVVPLSMPSSIVHSGVIDLTFRYDIWLPLIATLIILLTTQKTWSYMFSEIATLLMLSAVCLMLLLLHDYSEDAREWYCDMGTNACASATSDEEVNHFHTHC